MHNFYKKKFSSRAWDGLIKKWQYDLCQKYNASGKPPIQRPWRSLQQRKKEKKLRKAEERKRKCEGKEENVENQQTENSKK